MAGGRVARARAVARRALHASPYRKQVWLPTVVPLAAPLVVAADTVRRRRPPVQSVDQLEGSLPPEDREVHASCPLCHADAVRVRFHVRLHGGASQYRVGQCERCDLLYRVPAIRPERVPELYQGGTYADFLDGDYGARRQQLYTDVLAAYAPALDDGHGLASLDFGCGTGRFMEVAAARGFDAYGVDLAQDAVALARERFGASHVAQHPEDLERPPAGGFDLITLWSVLAHLATPKDQLRELHDLLAPGGRLLLYTVNAESLRRRAFGRRWSGFTTNHLIFWSREPLRRLLLEVGFDAVEFRHMYEVPSADAHLSSRLVRRHRRAVERWNGAHMLSALATKAAPAAGGPSGHH